MVEQSQEPTKIAFLGNSMIYFNDLPRMFQAISGGNTKIFTGDCLRGGTSLTSLLKLGNGMEKIWNTPIAKKEDGTYDIGANTI